MAANEWHVGPRTVTTASTFRFPTRNPTNSSPARRKPLDRVLTTLFGTSKPIVTTTSAMHIPITTPTVERFRPTSGVTNSEAPPKSCTRQRHMFYDAVIMSYASPEVWTLKLQSC